MRKSWNIILSQSWILTQANLKARYRNSLAGYLWVFVSPLATFLAQAYVFKIIFKVQVENYLLFLLFGLLPWLFFSQTLDMVTTAFFYNARLLKSVKVHPLALILAQTMDNLINNISVMAILLLCLQIFSHVPWNKIYLFPLPYIILAVLATTVGFFLSSLHVQFYDVRFVVNFLLGILYFISPVLYPEKFVPQEFKFLLALNPFNYILRPWRSLMETGPSLQFWQQLLTAAVLTGSIALLTAIYWKRKRNVIYLRL